MFIINRLPTLLATGLTTISFGQMHFSPVNVKKKTTTTVTTVTTRTATKTDRKTFPVLSYTKKEDQLLQQFTAGRMRTDR